MDVRGARKVSVSSSWRLNSCSRMNGSGNDFMDNIYHHGLAMFGL
jgi:hypothetical protein